jgi:ParB family chromosome partitioning protein
VTRVLPATLTDNERAQVARPSRDPMEIAKMLKALSDKYRLSHAQLAAHVGRRRSTVTNYLRLLSLPLNIQQSVSTGEISMGHAKLLLSLASREMQFELHERILRELLTIREANAVTQDRAFSRRTENADALHQKAVAESLQEHFGTRVEINDQRIILHYHDVDDLQRLLEKMGAEL